MPNNAKPRKKHGKHQLPQYLPSGGAAQIMHQLHPTDQSIKLDAKRHLALYLTQIDLHTATACDIEKLQQYGMLSEALTVLRYGGEYQSNTPMFQRFDAAIKAALRRGHSGLTYGFNPNELEDIYTVVRYYAKQLDIVPQATYCKTVLSVNNKIQRHNMQSIEKIRKEYQELLSYGTPHDDAVAKVAASQCIPTEAVLSALGVA